MDKFRFVLVFTLILSHFTSSAQQPDPPNPIDIELKQCLDSNQTTIGIIECTQNAEKKWDVELNRFYKLLLGKLGASEQQNLRESQRQWVAFKEKETKFYMSLYGKMDGSMWGISIAERALSITRQRALELQEYYETITQH